MYQQKNKRKIEKNILQTKITMSEYVRHLINFAIAFNDINNLENKKDSSTRDVDKIISLLGGTFND